MRILLVEDDPATAETLELILRKARLTCDLTDSGEQAIELVKLYDYDLILLDLTLADIDGYEVLRRLRLGKIETPVLILTGREGTEAMLEGFGLGADDYLTKPFDREELLARIHALVRRSMGHPEAIIRTGAIAVNIDAKTVLVEGRPLRLTGKEYEVLELLSLRKGTTISKEMFLNHLYGGIDEPEMKIIDVFVCKLRKKLAQTTGGSSFIETVWGRGYALRDPYPESDLRSEVAAAPVEVLCS